MKKDDLQVRHYAAGRSPHGNRRGPFRAPTMFFLAGTVLLAIPTGQAASSPRVAASAAAQSAADTASQAAARTAHDAGQPEEVSMLPPSRGDGPRYSIAFKSADDKLRLLMLDHKAKCEALGSTRCRVQEFSPDGWQGQQSQTLNLRFAPGQARGFMDTVARTNGDVGFTISSDQSSAPRYDPIDDVQLRIVLLDVQRQKLEMLKAGASDARLTVILRNVSRIESELASLKQQLAQQARPPESELLTISYQSNKPYAQSRSDRQFEELWKMFWMSLLVVTGVAVLTGVYFGIIGVALLGLKRLAVRMGVRAGTAGSGKADLPEPQPQPAKRALPEAEAEVTPPE